MIRKKIIQRVVQWGIRKLEALYNRLDAKGYKSLKDSTAKPETKKEQKQVNNYVKNYHTIKKMVCDLNNKNCKFVD